MAEVFLALILAAIAVGELPPFRFNRATLALVGAILILVLGLLPLEAAYAAIDWNTLALLFAMMVFTTHLRLAGFFDLAGQALGRSSRSPWVFLVLLLGASALLSALFINDTVALLLTPLVIQVTMAAGLNPLPFLMGLAVSANIGSMTTPIGNPQNILIATQSGLGFGEFTSALVVPALVSLALAWVLIVVVYRKDWTAKHLAALPARAPRIHRALLAKCAAALAVMVVGFALGWPLALAALAGAAVLLFTRRVKPTKVLARIDGSLLLFFAALFVVTRAVEATGGFQALVAWSRPLLDQNLMLFSGLAAVLSNLISNVPAVMVLKPLIPGLADPHRAWIALAAASTLAGNLTLFGSVANLIVAESARTYGIKLSFGEYLKVGLPLAVGSIALTAGWLILFP
jgi:Na+/H+ antiporter NhaD/arsenite permease-like protein